MKRSLSLILLIGALLGLFGQATAFAMGPPVTPTIALAAQSMPMDCAEMPQKDADESKPCTGLTLDCIAAMGCSVPAVLSEAPLDLADGKSAPLEASSSTPVLAGRSIAPEPYPPTLLI